VVLLALAWVLSTVPLMATTILVTIGRSEREHQYQADTAVGFGRSEHSCAHSSGR
jgi:hypothetical protein